MYFCLKSPVGFETNANEQNPVGDAVYNVSVYLTATYTIQFRGINQVNVAGTHMHTNPPDILANPPYIGPGNPPAPGPQVNAGFANNFRLVFNYQPAQ